MAGSESTEMGMRAADADSEGTERVTGAPTTSQNMWRTWGLRIAGTLLFIALLIWLDLQGVLPLEQVWAALKDANPLLVGLSIALYTPFLVVKAARWRMLSKDMLMPLRWRDAWRIYAIGLAAGTFTPGQAGDALKAWYLQRMGYPLGRALGSSIFDRLFDVAALAVLGLLGIAVYGQRFAGQTPALILLTIACIAIVAFFAWNRTREWAVKVVKRRLSRWRANGERQAADDSGAWSLRSGTLANAGLLTVASFATSIFRVWLLAAALGVWLGPLEVSGFVGLTTAVALVPVTVGGVGTRDAVAALAFTQLGLLPAQGIAVSLLILVLNLAQAVTGWVIWLRYDFTHSSRKGIAPLNRRGTALILLLMALVVVLLYVAGAQKEERFRAFERRDFASRNNLLVGVPFVSRSLTSTVEVYTPPPTSKPFSFNVLTDTRSILPQSSLVGAIAVVRPNEICKYSLYTARYEEVNAQVQVRLLWLDNALDVLSWSDSPVWDVGGGLGSVEPEFRSGSYRVPAKATHLQFEIRNLTPRREGESAVTAWITSPKLSCGDVYVKSHPNGTQGSIAFSFDWESAIGGAIHSKGMKEHDPSTASTHGLEMRQGADWLNSLFTDNNIHATFYGTGYNLLDGNTERRTFSGDPIYKWAAPRNRWETDYWLTHKWYSDDPYGTYQTHPAWYFGDQTRRLLDAGHEVAPHTFGHLYVRGSNPQELATDMDEWLAAARSLGITNTTTFAFPWRSSNSLTADFYDVLYKRGIRAVTRIYERDMKDLYTLGAPSAYPNISVMPDFLLGSPSLNAGEEAGKEIGHQEGLQVIAEALSRRGTTSFWTHPEQLADGPQFQDVRAAWADVVTEAARQRDNGKLWIATVADITAYQRDIMSVTTSLDDGFLGMGGWKVQIP